MPQRNSPPVLQRPDYLPPYLQPGRPGRGGRQMPVVKPRDFKGSFKRLWRFFMDAMELPGHVDFSLLGTIVTVLLVAYLTDAGILFIQSNLMAGVSQRIVRRLRGNLFQKLQKLPISFFDTHSHGDLMSRLTNDIDNINTTISQNLVALMSDIIGIVGSLTLMLILSPLLTLAAMVTVPMVMLLSRTITRRTRKLFKEQQTVLGKLNGHIEESVSGIYIVKAFNHETAMAEEFAKVNNDLCRVGLKAQIWSGYLMQLMNVISNLGFAAIACFGGVLAVQGSISVGVIASFLGYSRQFSRPLNNIANIFNSLQTAVAGAERIFEILDEKEERPDVPAASEMHAVRGEVEFRNVQFSYHSRSPVIKDLSFQVKAGSTIALVGPTGAGKTTIVNLINRFYDVDAGEILIDGVSINNYKRDSLRRSFGIVLQDTYLFSGSIRENIRYGRPEATDEQVRNAAVMSGADKFIRKLPETYDSLLTESGSNISEGERQLLAIARAVLADPSILILDEATSSVDTRTEMQIQNAMVSLMQGRTCFIIAHRLSTIRNADCIIVIDKGTIIESGTHDQLLAQKGFYYELFSCQYNNVAI